MRLVRLLILAFGLILSTVGQTTSPTPLLVTRITGISSSSTIIDNRSTAIRSNTIHTFCATGSGTWSAVIQYQDGGITGSWTSFSGAAATVSNSSSNCIGGAQGYHDYIRFSVTGTVTVEYSGTRLFYPQVNFAGASGAPTGSTYITQTCDGTLSAEQCLSSLATGILKSTTATGVVSIAVGADLPSHNHAAGDINSGQLATARGGTAADLSATGGANQIVRQNSLGGAFTVSALADADVPDTITLTNITQIANRAISDTSGDLAASRVDDGGVAATQALFSGAGASAGFRAIVDGDIPDTITASNYQLLSQKDAASGYAGLTAGTKINLAHGQEVWALADLSNVTATSGSGSTVVLNTSPTLAGTPVIGDGAGNDNLEFTEEATNPACAAGNYRVWANSADLKLKKCENGSITDLDTSGGAVAFSAITAGTNTNPLVIGVGGSLTVSGGGTITATDGDTATAFFTAGQIEAARGGTGDDTSASTGVPRIASGNWTYDAALSHLAIGPLTTRGDILTVNVTPALARLAIGAAKKALFSDGTDPLYQFSRTRSHATDCTSLTDGNEGETCYEQDADTLYVCEPTAGLCDTAGEWRLVSGGGGTGLGNYSQAFSAQTSVALTHNAGHSKVVVKCYDNGTPAQEIQWNTLQLTDINTATVTFSASQSGTCIVNSSGGGTGPTFLSGTAVINFGSITDGLCADSTFTLTGALTTDYVAPRIPSGLETGLVVTMFISSANTVTVRACNLSGVNPFDPASATFGAMVLR